MAIHLRQICLVARQLQPTIDALTDVLGIPVVFVDPAVGRYGLENTLMLIGTQFLEVVAPTEDGTAAGRFMDRIGGDGGYMVITQSSSRDVQESVRANAAANGVRVANERDHGWYRLFQLHPGDMGASFFSAPWVEGGDPVGRWPFGGDRVWMDKRDQCKATAITAAELRATDPEALAKHWAAVAGREMNVQDGVPGYDLDNVRIRFVPAGDQPQCLAALDLTVDDVAATIARAKARGLPTSEDSVTICGTRFNLSA
ncbi:VOC family protein [Pseudooceanicola sp.]|uniref:VOC family protein n=1 Tax=Pseudooceanicola sp. TaxID=1914328 RepID=UPI0026295E59|nr:VOC family protein [Pseudooceanicola sp.]MDF1856179.1 VOC family protein [Pseudooceanicola sp.]